MQENPNDPLEEELPPVDMQRIPPASCREVLKGQLPVILTELLLTGLMLAVYALLGKCSVGVLLGAVLGCGSALLFFVLLVLSVLQSEKKPTPVAAQATVRLFYLLRLALLAAILIVALLTKIFDPLATVLPVLFYRVSLFLSELFRKKGEKAS